MWNLWCWCCTARLEKEKKTGELAVVAAAAAAAAACPHGEGDSAAAPVVVVVAVVGARTWTVLGIGAGIAVAGDWEGDLAGTKEAGETAGWKYLKKRFALQSQQAKRRPFFQDFCPGNAVTGQRPEGQATEGAEGGEGVCSVLLQVRLCPFNKNKVAVVAAG